MTKLFAGAAIAAMACLSLAACGGLNTAAQILSINVANPVTDQRLQTIHAGYNLYLEAADQYWSGVDGQNHPLPVTLNNRTLYGLSACMMPVREPCAHRAVVDKLQAATRATGTAVRNLDNWVAANPNVTAGSLYDAAEKAVATANQIFAR